MFKSPRRIEYAIMMLLLGLTVSVIFSFVLLPQPISNFGVSLGLAFLVSGLVAIYQEAMNLKIGTPDEPLFTEIITRLNHPDIRKIHDERGRYTRYHEWSGIEEKNDIFFAGHSVLHRIKADFENLPIKSAEKAILKKLDDGSRIRVLFLDPSWEYAEEIIKSQNQPSSDFYRDLLVTLSMTKNISDEVLKSPSRRGSIEIKMCRANLQYSYHYIKNEDNKKIEMLVGFYFAGLKGIESPLFQVESRDIQQYFESHFDKVFRDATRLLIYNSHERQFYPQNYSTCFDYLHGKNMGSGGGSRGLSEPA